MRLDLKCLRCDHEWLRRNLTKLPVHCPECNSPYWNKPRNGAKRERINGHGKRKGGA
jgi:DNA-directed RNA polymerase subunit RPC12/RpoP